MKNVDVMMYAGTVIIISVLFFIAHRETKKRLKLEKIIRDRTEELRRSRTEQIQQLSKMAEFGKLSQGLFHDLLNPLSSVALGVEKLYKSDPQKNEKIKSQVNMTVLASRKMAEYISTIRNTINPDGQKKLYPIHESIEKSLNLLSYKARNSDVAVNNDAEDFSIYCNPMHLDRVFLNLISNAIDSFEKIEDDRERVIEISAKDSDKKTEISVSDNGCGIDTENLPKIFKEFFTTKTLEKGSGIGLSVTKSIVEEYLGGKINVKSELGRGSVFTITLPSL